MEIRLTAGCCGDFEKKMSGSSEWVCKGFTEGLLFELHLDIFLMVSYFTQQLQVMLLSPYGKIILIADVRV